MEFGEKEYYLENYGATPDDFEISLEKAQAKFGEKLKMLCSLKNFTLKDLSEKSGVSYSYLTKLVRGDVPPNIDVLLKIMQVLELEPYELIKLFLFDEDIRQDEKGLEFVLELFIYKASARKGAELRLVGDFNMQNDFSNNIFYDIKPATDDFITQVVKYRYHTYYKGKFADIKAQWYEEKVVQAKMEPQKMQKGVLKDIVEMIHELDDGKLQYIKACISTYLEFHSDK